MHWKIIRFHLIIVKLTFLVYLYLCDMKGILVAF